MLSGPLRDCSAQCWAIVSTGEARDLQEFRAASGGHGAGLLIRPLLLLQGPDNNAITHLRDLLDAIDVIAGDQEVGAADEDGVVVRPEAVAGLLGDLSREGRIAVAHPDLEHLSPVLGGEILELDVEGEGGELALAVVAAQRLRVQAPKRRGRERMRDGRVVRERRCRPGESSNACLHVVVRDGERDLLAERNGRGKTDGELEVAVRVAHKGSVRGIVDIKLEADVAGTVHNAECGAQVLLVLADVANVGSVRLTRRHGAEQTTRARSDAAQGALLLLLASEAEGGERGASGRARGNGGDDDGR